MQGFAEEQDGTGDEWFVKHNIFRKVLESFPVDSSIEAKNHINKLYFELGPFSEDYDFIVEKKIKGKTEVGFEGFFNGNEFLRPILWGRERGKPYCGVWAETLPPFMEDFIKKFTPELRRRNYKGLIAVEFIVINKDLAYPIDVTGRFCTPLGVILTESVDNYTDVLLACAKGEDIAIENTTKYVMGVQIDCPHSDDNWLLLDIKEADRNRVKMYGCCYADDHYQIVPGTEGKIYLISLGENIDKMITEIEGLSKKIDGFEIDDSHINDLYKIRDEVKKYSSYGIEF